MHIHVLGICGTFMGGLALIARQLGHRVTGSDANVYPPMSTQLREQGIELTEGYDPAQLQPAPDLVVVGNALSRGNAAVEYMLDHALPYTSGPQWLCDHLLKDCWVLAVAGTHGKTTASSMLAWILEDCGYHPGFLIGGVPANFGISARATDSSFFVIEADEYDSAFFDKRSKFVHYRPRTLVLNNLEFDHADIFDDLAAIQRQFHHLLRTVPASGRIVMPAEDDNLQAVIDQGCWSERETLSVDGIGGADWRAQACRPDGSEFDVFHGAEPAGTVRWTHTGAHNMHNALAALAAAHHVGVAAVDGVAALCRFLGVKRRMEVLADIDGVLLYDDFAHHPTAIETTLQGLRHKVGGQRIVAVIEPRSNTMRLGVHLERLAPSTAGADEVIWYQPEGLDWSLEQVVAECGERGRLYRSTQAIIDYLLATVRSGDHVVIMSNGGFEGIHGRLLQRLREKAEQAGA